MKNIKCNTSCKVLIAVLLSFILSAFIFSSQGSLALEKKKTASNESLQAKEIVDIARKDILEMASRNIPINRVNESYLEALQMYSAQVALEEKGSKADFKLIIEYATKINTIKDTALEASDELAIFKEILESAKKEANFSEFEEEYRQILLSFDEERFEDTIVLINKGYERISEIQSSQTAAKAFYLTTSRTIKNFLIKNKYKILITFSIIFILASIFRKTIINISMRIRLNNLILQKQAINGLIKETQALYFKKRTISENEYRIKLKKYNELIRDIDRQVMVLREEMFKIDRKTAKYPKKF